MCLLSLLSIGNIRAYLTYREIVSHTARHALTCFRQSVTGINLPRSVAICWALPFLANSPQSLRGHIHPCRHSKPSHESSQTGWATSSPSAPTAAYLTPPRTSSATPRAMQCRTSSPPSPLLSSQLRTSSSRRCRILSRSSLEWASGYVRRILLLLLRDDELIHFTGLLPDRVGTHRCRLRPGHLVGSRGEGELTCAEHRWLCVLTGCLGHARQRHRSRHQAAPWQTRLVLSLSTHVTYYGLLTTVTGRVLRFLATRHVFEEVAPDVFRNTRLSSGMSLNKSVKDILARYGLYWR